MTTTAFDATDSAVPASATAGGAAVAVNTDVSGDVTGSEITLLAVVILSEKPLLSRKMWRWCIYQRVASIS